MFVFVGASLAGLYLILKDLFPFLAAKQSGAVWTRGHARKRVLRSEEPDRFRNLCSNHVDGMVIGLMAVGFGIAWVLFGLFALILILPIGAVMGWQSKRASRRARRIADEFS